MPTHRQNPSPLLLPSSSMISPSAFDTSPSTPSPPYRSRATSSPLNSHHHHRKFLFSSTCPNNRDYLPSPEPLGSSRVLTKSPKWWRSPKITTHSRQRRNSSSPNIILPKQPPPPPPSPATSINKYEVMVFSLCILAVFFTWTVLEFELTASSPQVSVLSVLCGALSLALLALCLSFICTVSFKRKTSASTGFDVECQETPRPSRSASMDTTKTHHHL